MGQSLPRRWGLEHKAELGPGKAHFELVEDLAEGGEDAIGAWVGQAV